jgi:hypothetical protein
MSICSQSMIARISELKELDKFRGLAAAYAVLDPKQVEQLLKNERWVEICHDGTA